MTREQAIKFLQCSKFTDEHIKEISSAFEVADGKDISEVVNQAYDQGKEDGYEKAKKYLLFLYGQDDNILRSANKFYKSTLQDAIERMRFGKIEVGDEVYLLDENNKKVVTEIHPARYGLVATTITSSGKFGESIPVSQLRKTGKHYDEIPKVLLMLQEEN